MQKLYQASDAMQANLLKDHLAAYHIQAVVLGDYLSGAAGELPAINFPAVWLVKDRDLVRARQLLAEFLTPVTPASAWQCPGCAADVDGEFALCWRCGTPRPEETA
jgi:hypothetical protein